MIRVLIIGAEKKCIPILNLLIEAELFEIVAVVDKHQDAPGLVVAKQFQLKTGCNWEYWLKEPIDIIIDATGSGDTYDAICKIKEKDTEIITLKTAILLSELMKEQLTRLHTLETDKFYLNAIFSKTNDGIVMVDAHEMVTFMNSKAEEIIGVNREEALSKPIRVIIDHSRLPNVLRTRRKEIDQQMTLKNGKSILTTRIPIIDSNNILLGAVAIIREFEDLIKLTEKIMDVHFSGIKHVVRAIFNSTDEVINIVDNENKEIISTPALKKIMKADEHVENSLDLFHRRVLQTNRTEQDQVLISEALNKEFTLTVNPIKHFGEVKGSMAILHDVTDRKELADELKKTRQLIRNIEGMPTFEDVAGSSSVMTVAIEQAKAAAKTSGTILLRGESGTGKELFAKAIHNESNRRHNKFIRVDCSMKDEAKLEQLLFGKDNPYNEVTGLLEQAKRGTIFLDEVSELSIRMQKRLLQLLDENKFVRGSTMVSLDTRIITATKKNLEKAIVDGTLMENLYYRLNRLSIYIPSLSERMEDLPEIALFLINKLNQFYGRNISGIDKEALTFLKQHHWPGNVSELNIILSHAMLFIEPYEDTIKRDHLPSLERKPLTRTIECTHLSNRTLQQSMELYEKDIIHMALKENNYNKTKTAEALGISIRNLYYKMDKYGF
ncbi:sigma 54-interacting transcriptional regulator [Aquibacillus albus]|uniref:PAS domain S-box-containing protein n=1 Tax=Aquibacillus albus TaxID=1168171 RepID=A0ABS2MUZ8_9BACI|nr:sigma 54-interacting transcriptional regulator [Aquibacillus albus]MBM7569721.1 PAS domain S-box-containing protein [Aquibacillus albus]